MDCFVRPTFIIMALTRSERKFDWPLHPWALRQMMPYLFAASHVNCARYGLYNLHSMETLPSKLKHYFLQKQHIRRHAASATNSTWSDMFSETTFMRYGHNQGGLTEISPKDNAMQRWSIRLHTCSSYVISYITAMRNQTHRTLAHYKEETPGRIQAASADRHTLREKLAQCTNSLDPNDQPPALFNIAIGRLAESSMNIHRAPQIWTSSMNHLLTNCQSDFMTLLAAVASPCQQLGRQQNLDQAKDLTQVWYSAANWESWIRVTSTMYCYYYHYHHQSPVPQDDGNMRPLTSKSKMKNCLVVEQSLRTLTHPDVIMLDGYALLWSVWGIDHGREGVTATTPEWFVVRRRDVPRAQLWTTNHEGVVAVTPDRPWSIPVITWPNNVILHVFTTKYVQNHHQIERRGLLASIVTSRISP